MPHESYVIDFFIRKTELPIVIELNPFDHRTGGALFKWYGKDREVILNGPLEFRFCNSELGVELYLESLTVPWEKIFISKFKIINIPGHEELKKQVLLEEASKQAKFASQKEEETNSSFCSTM